MELTAKEVQSICKELKLYITPSLNEQLYLNFRGITKLGGLEAYTGLKSIFLEGNALSDLKGLPHLPGLQCLFVQNNVLNNLAGLPENLTTLNISGNRLPSLTGLERCSRTLTTLIASDNIIDSIDALSAIFTCSDLESLDLQNNKLPELDTLVAYLAQALPNLKCLYLRGNPLVTASSNYRKRVIASLESLTYFDDRPVSMEERRCAKAWLRGGVEAEREERALCLQDRRDQDTKDFQALQQIKAEVRLRRLRRQNDSSPPTRTNSETSVLHPCSPRSSTTDSEQVLPALSEAEEASSLYASVYDLEMD